MPTKFILGLGEVGVSVTPGTSQPSVSVLTSGQPSADVTVTTSGSIVTSLISDEMSFSTIFEDFDLVAEPVYRFFEEGEEEDISAVRDPLVAPRLVRLTWRPAARRSVTLRAKLAQPTQDNAPTSFDRGGISFGSLPVLDLHFAAHSLANGYFTPGVIHASVEPPAGPMVPVSFDEFSFLAGNDGRTNDALSLVSVPTAAKPLRLNTPPSRMKVSFVDPAIDGVFSEERVNSITSPQAANVTIALSKLGSNLQVISGRRKKGGKGVPPPSFPSVPELIGVQYMGYLIERHRIGADGIQTLDATIEVSDPETTSVVDLDVLFEVQYSYRIRSIVRWTRDGDTGFDKGSKQQSPGIPSRANVGPLTSHVSSFYAGDWSRWADARVVDEIIPDPPRDIQVRPVSSKGEVHVAWVEPFDPQRDLSEIVLVRRTVDRSGDFTSPWSEISRFTVGNGFYVDRTVETQEDRPGYYVYALYTVSVHNQVSVLSEQVGAALTRRWRYSGELPLLQVSSPGATLTAAGDTSVVPFRRKDLDLVPRDAVRFSCRPGAGPSPVLDKRYVLAVRSLSTGEQVTVDLNLDAHDVVRRTVTK